MLVSQPLREQFLTFDLHQLPDGFYDDPFSTYRRLREESPVYRCPDGSFFLTRYDDCAQVYRDPRFSSDKRRMFKPNFGDGPLYSHHTTSLVFNDPPYHTRVRGLLVDALKPSAIRAMRPVLEDLVDGLLKRASASDGEVDLIEAFAGPIPLEVIGNLLTVPREERESLRGWSLSILGALEVGLSDELRRQGEQAVEDFIEYLLDLIARRRQSGSQGDTDMLTPLIESHDAGDMTEEELIHNLIFILNAGHETTTNLIANGVYELATRPDVVEGFVRDTTVTKTTVEEVLRYQSPNQLGNREATTDVQIGGVDIPKGAQIHLCVGAANRDPERFDHPDEFNIRRHPNPHLAFATGVHSCVGMSLARLEGQIALRVLFDRCQEIQVVREPQWQRRARFRGFQSLPVRLK